MTHRGGYRSVGGETVPSTGFPAALPLAIVLALAVCCIASSGEEVPVPAPSDGDGWHGTGTVDGAGVPGDPGGPAEGQELPHAPSNASSGGLSGPPVEIPPPIGDAPFEHLLPGNPLFLLALLATLGVLAAYAPGEIRRMRIEAALRESMDGRLALARGAFAEALAAFDRAIEQAHPAYTRRRRVGGPAEWVLIPDRFYIGLWRGRAAALVGLGRTRSAAAISRLADELESLPRNGGG